MSASIRLTPRYGRPLAALLLALVTAPGCSRRDAPAAGGAVDAGDAGAPAASGAAASPESLAPLVGLGTVPGNPPVTTVEDFHWKDTPGEKTAVDDTFLLEIGMGDGRDALNVTTLPASGHASHVYQVRRGAEVTWQRVTFDVDRVKLEALVRVINDRDFLHLPQVYQAHAASGGALWVFHVRTGGLDKMVTADSAFPDPLVALARAVAADVIDARPALRAQSKPTELGPEYGKHLFRAAKRYSERTPDPGAASFQSAARLAGLVTLPGPPPDDLRIEASVVDQSVPADDEDRVVAHSVQQTPRFWVFYDAGKIDNRHRYTLDLQVSAAGKPLGHASLPVLTYDGAFAFELALQPRDGG